MIGMHVDTMAQAYILREDNLDKCRAMELKKEMREKWFGRLVMAVGLFGGFSRGKCGIGW